ncbi:MAG: YggT family protein [Clostridia bacterium]|nr:YggT family protein [Clostridia bacterium]
MTDVLHLISTVAMLLLSAVQLAMLLRAILSWFPMDSNRFTDFLFGITEPFIYPVRLLFEKLNWFQNLPIDISFLVTYLLLSLLTVFL